MLHLLHLYLESIWGIEGSSDDLGKELSKAGVCEDIICELGNDCQAVVCIWESGCVLLNSWLLSISAESCCTQVNNIECNEAGRVTKM